MNLLKTLIISAVVASSYISKAQSAQVYIEDLPELEIPNLYGLSNEYMRSLKKDDQTEIPEHLFKLWKDAEVYIAFRSGKVYQEKVSFFNTVRTRAVGRIVMTDNYNVVLFCDFEGSQTWGILVSYDTKGNILSYEICYIEDVEGVGFFRSSVPNQLILLMSGENHVEEDIIQLTDEGYFQSVSSQVYDNGYDFSKVR